MSSKTTTFPQTYQIQFSFQFEVTQRLLELARALPDDVYRATIGYSHGSIHNTFVHLLGADYLWRNAIADMPILFPEMEDIASIDAIAALLETERTGWLELLAKFDEATLLGTFKSDSPIGPRVIPVWRTLQHVVLHTLQHQTEIARMLTEAGLSPGDIDFFWDEAAI